MKTMTNLKNRQTLSTLSSVKNMGDACDLFTRDELFYKGYPLQF